MARSAASLRVSFGDTRPSAISGCIAWYEADNGVTLDGSGNVQQLNDLSGNGAHLIQSTSTDRPSYDPTSINGLPAVSFSNGLQKILTGTTTFGGGSHSLVVCYKRTAASTNFGGGLSLGSSGTNFQSSTIGVNNSSQIWLGGSGYGVGLSATFTLNQAFVIGKAVSGKRIEGWISGEQISRVDEAGTISPTPATAILMGSYIVSGISNSPIDVYGGAAWSRTLGPGEMRNASYYFMKKAGISIPPRLVASARSPASVRSAA